MSTRRAWCRLPCGERRLPCGAARDGDVALVVDFRGAVERTEAGRPAARPVEPLAEPLVGRLVDRAVGRLVDRAVVARAVEPVRVLGRVLAVGADRGRGASRPERADGLTGS
ncbi:MAG: hypothetical protein ACXWBN_08825 [Acidimicrobiales bacterium]